MELKREKETHLLILWSEALGFKEEAFEAIGAQFAIRRVFEVEWNKADFDANLRVFYAHSQKHLSPRAYAELLASKKEHCGDEPFVCVVFDDLNPVYEERSTTDGVRPVNIHIFDLKQELRAQTGGGHKIHGTDNAFECNKDLTLLLGCNLADFDKKYPGSSPEEIEIKTNCTGVGGYRDISELFYVLNNTIDYCVMRNYECLPDTYTLEGHGDIDLLVESLNYVVYLTGAEAVFPETAFRVHYTIRIGEEDIPFDFRFLGDDYYDLKWELDLLKSKRIFNEVIYVPDAVNYFYSLLYHAYIHKPEVNEDYHERLRPLGKAAGVDYHKGLSAAEVRGLLDAYMLKRGYGYTVPADESVFYNKLFLKGSALDLHTYGNKISESQCRYENRAFISQVFEKDGVITKMASREIVENEVEFLGRLAEYEYFPKVLDSEVEGDYGFVQLGKIEGEGFSTAFEKKGFWTKANLHGLIADALRILELLLEHNIIHRDIRPDNLILTYENDRFRLKLIDFGWAASLDKANKSITPRHLGSSFRFGRNEFSDAHSLGKSISYYFVTLPFFKQFSDGLIAITPEEYGEPEKLLAKLKDSQARLQAGDLGIEEQLRLFYYRSPMLKKIKHSVSKLVK